MARRTLGTTPKRGPISRTTHNYSGELVIFLIGMRVRQPWRPDLWGPAFAAMPRMLTELMKDKESGLLGFRMTLGSGGPMIVQYWNSQQKLYAYASNPTAEHRPAWAAFNLRAKKAPGAVGVWHETYVVEAAESMYVGMPEEGLAHATKSVPVTAETDHAIDRLTQGRSE